MVVQIQLTLGLLFLMDTNCPSGSKNALTLAPGCHVRSCTMPQGSRIWNHQLEECMLVAIRYIPGAFTPYTMLKRKRKEKKDVIVSESEEPKNEKKKQRRLTRIMLGGWIPGTTNQLPRTWKISSRFDGRDGFDPRGP